MVTTLDLQLLQSVRQFPAVSLLCSAAPSVDETVRRLTEQHREAADRLASQADPATAAFIDEQLARQIDAVDGVTAPTVAVFASRRLARWMALPLPVRDRVVIDTTFATRDLVHAHARLRRYLVLLLDGKQTTLFEGRGAALEAVHDDGFSLSQPRSAEAGADRSRRTERSELRDAELRRFVRAIDDQLGPVIAAEPAPLLLVGATRRLQVFRDASRHATSVAATIPWIPDRRPVHLPNLAAKIESEVEAVLDAERAAAVDELGRARGARRYSSGIDEVWNLARDGRGELLVVEENFEYPAERDYDSPHLRPAEEPDAPGVIADAVDEAIEDVLRQGGRVVVVRDGVLADQGRVALALRH